jgi:uncharacterized RDD family membrane protein YckC
VPAQYEVYAPVPAAPDGRPLAGAGERFLAKLLDGLLLAVAIIVGMLPFGLLIGLTADGDSPLPAVFAVIGIVLAAIGVPYLYDVEYALRNAGQTLGKRVMKITVIPLQPGAPLTRGAMAKRWGVSLLFNLLSNCYVGLLDPLWLLWDKPYKQTLHDKAASTVVIKLPPR